MKKFGYPTKSLDDLKSSESFKEAINLFPDLEIINVKDLEEDSNE